MSGMDLRVARIRLRLRQADVAIVAGVSRQRVSGLERQRQVSQAAADRLLQAIERAAGPAGRAQYRPLPATA